MNMYPSTENIVYPCISKLHCKPFVNDIYISFIIQKKKKKCHDCINWAINEVKTKKFYYLIAVQL